ncbi:FecR family protein [Lacihabitans sp. CCS-44]|uniref:FecR family protein n=1 Tax=Lacihabitans sp. CCS-44 TaxID=2487331 RepID=UPI0020CE211D|nr:FecR family protein [Lacihabitans sp. CCS-44]MCP9757202.1 FecR family protein [Lacihabitans sp. CCS-44]
MQDYTMFTVSDFLMDDKFVGQHLKPTHESEVFWKESNLDLLNKDYLKAVEILNTLVLGMKNYETQNLSEEAKTFIFQKISETNKPKFDVFVSPNLKIWLGAAAVILMSVAIYLAQRKSIYQTNLTHITDQIIETKNTLNIDMLIHLPDGSAVKLAPKSKLSYPANFDSNKRVVILSGKATFDVAKDASRQFLVFANEVTTKVLGTRFVVNAYENSEQVEVTVEEGKVSVYKNKINAKNELTGVILLPNQQAIFDRQSDKYNKNIIKLPSIIDNKKLTKFVFDEDSFVEVLQMIEEAYGIEIEFDEVLLKNCQVTGSFENESLFQKLDILTKTIGGSYEIVEGKIIINARGC